MKTMRLLGLVLLLGGLAYGARIAWDSSYLELKLVEVAGNHKVSADLLVETSELRRGDHLLTVSTDEVATRLEVLAWVGSAKIERVLPSTIRITVTERTPAADVVVEGRRFLVDEFGVVLEEGKGAPLTVLGLPIETLEPGDRIELPQYRHAVRVFKGLPQEIRQAVASIHAPKVDRITVEGEGLTILYGAAEEIEAKNYAVTALMTRYRDSGEQLSYIDVRVPSRPATR